MARDAAGPRIGSRLWHLHPSVSCLVLRAPYGACQRGYSEPCAERSIRTIRCHNEQLTGVLLSLDDYYDPRAKLIENPDDFVKLLQSIGPAGQAAIDHGAPPLGGRL